MKIFLIISGLSGAMAVLMGASGAHMFHGTPGDYATIVFEKAVRYQMYHALALLGVAVTSVISPESIWVKISGVFFIIGTVLFSGSLYIIALTSTPMGLVTPAGGISFVFGWIFIAVYGFTAKLEN